MEFLFLGDIAVAAVLAVFLPVAYTLWRRASLRGLVLLGVVAFALFAAALDYEISGYLQLMGGGELVSWSPVIYALAGVAAAQCLAGWISWLWHRRRFSVTPTQRTSAST